MYTKYNNNNKKRQKKRKLRMMVKGISRIVAVQ
jgi:hypothetical protein